MWRISSRKKASPVSGAVARAIQRSMSSVRRRSEMSATTASQPPTRFASSRIARGDTETCKRLPSERSSSASKLEGARCAGSGLTGQERAPSPNSAATGRPTSASGAAPAIRANGPLAKRTRPCASSATTPSFMVSTSSRYCASLAASASPTRVRSSIEAARASAATPAIDR